MKKTFLFLLCAFLFLGAYSIVSADWNMEDPHKMHWPQTPKPGGWDVEFQFSALGDDFECTANGPISEIHFWISWMQNFVQQINIVNVEIYDDVPAGPLNPYSMPGNLLWQKLFTASEIIIRDMPDDPQSWFVPPNGFMQNDHIRWQQINLINIPEPFVQEEGKIYWLVINFLDMPFVGWKETDRNFNDAGVWLDTNAATPTWKPLYDPLVGTNVDLAFVINGEDTGPTELEYGDAPEDALAYPSTGVIGMFPTCKNVLVAGYIEHNNFGAYFGGPITAAGFDFEPDGNGGLCPAFGPYDNDECFMDGDAGLLFPDPATIIGGTLALCPGATNASLGQVCTTAAWGVNADIEITNNMPNVTMGYVNVLMDWDQDGKWAGISTCPSGTVAPEHVLVDFPIPNPYIGTLSALAPPPFMIGPNAGHVWTRFSITERPVGTGDWDGSGVFEDGETEDYLLEVTDVPDDEFDFGDAPQPAGALGYPTTLALNGARHLIISSGPWLGDASDTPDSEPDGQPDPQALGDDLDTIYPPINDDEDGVTIPILTAGGTATITFEVNGPAGGGGCVDAWIDFDGSGTWDASEQIIAACYANSVQSINITVPSTAAIGPTFARFRISTNGGLSPAGAAPDGEVEDHEVIIEEPVEPPVLKFQQLPLDGILLENGEEMYFGHDEFSTAYTVWVPDDITGGYIEVGYFGCYMADDFADKASTPVIKIKWWGSYLENFMDPGVTRFLVAWETDIPAVGQPGDVDYVASHPGQVIQSEIVTLGQPGALNPGEFSEMSVSPGGPPCNEMLYEYEAVLENPFPEEANTVYWLKIVALVDAPQGFVDTIQNCGLQPCDLGRMTWQNLLQVCPELEQYPMMTRWGWHNRDYTIQDTLASVPPAVSPGESVIGSVIEPSTGEELKVWHFQDDAVTGPVFIDPIDPAWIFIDQPEWHEQYYVYSWPLCPTVGGGVDGPPEIEQFSKDLAFELYTKDCVSTTAPFYADWITFGKPDCWCYAQNCLGDVDGAQQGNIITGYSWVSTDDLSVFLAAYNVKEAPHGPGVLSIIDGICADFSRSKQGNIITGYSRVSTDDLSLLLASYNVKEPPKGPGIGDCAGLDYNFWISP